MTKEKMDEFEKLVNQVLPTLTIEKKATSLYVFPEKALHMRGTVLQVLINAINLFGLSFWIEAEIGRGIRVEVF